MSCIGIVGLGLMGNAIGQRLRTAGMSTAGYDVDAQKRDAFATAGGTPVASLAELAQTCDTIFLAVFSTWWLKRFHFGPFEWLLRSFTYWKWQPMKKKEIIQVAKQS